MKNKYYIILHILLLNTLNVLAQDANFRGIPIEKNAISYKNKYSLIIGINTYKDDKIPKLRYAVNDAKEISQLLVSQLGFDSKNVIVLLDSLATRANILDTIQKFINSETIPENSQLLVYFAGHGTVSKSGNKGFLLNYDAKEGSEFSTAISMEDVGRITNECRSKHVLFLIDACYGGFANTRSASGAFVKNVWNQKARHVITAGSSDEKVIESSTWQHSAFTKVLLDGIGKHEADVNNDNIVSSSELHLYLEQRIAFYAKQKGGKQTPQLGKLSPDDGTFFLELTPGALAKVDENAQMLNDDEISEKLFSKVILSSNVNTARVFLDGLEVGFLVNGKFEYGVRPGFYRFELKLDKYENASIEALISPDSTIKLNIRMERKFSTVHFNVLPADAAVSLNGNLIGTGSFITEIPKGRHEILIDKKGFKPDKAILNLIQDEVSLSFEIKKIISTIELNSSPPGALVSTENEALGKTPLNITLGFGQHSLFFSKNGYTTKQLLIEVKESAVQHHDVLLNEKVELIVAREVSHIRKKSFGNFVLCSAFSAGGFFSYNYFSNKISNLNNIPNTQNDLDLLKVGKYSSIALSGVFAIGAVSNIFKLFSVIKEKLLRKKLEENSQIGFTPLKNGILLNFNYTF